MLCRWLVPFHSGPWVCTSSAWADEMANLQWACTSYKYCVLTRHGATIWYIQLLIFNIHVFFIELGLVSTQLTNSTWVVYGSSRICKFNITWDLGRGGDREQPLFVPSFPKTRIGQNFEHQGHKLQDSYVLNVYNVCCWLVWWYSIVAKVWLLIQRGVVRWMCLYCGKCFPFF